MIAIIDYGVGNLFSLQSSLAAIGAETVVTGDPAVIRTAEKLILPGVGAFGDAAALLRQNDLDKLVCQEVAGGKPLLGICLGMQLLCAYSEEGETECLGVFPNRVRRFPADAGVKVPHVGWNSIHDLKSPLYKDIKEDEYVYYVHSYAAEINECTAAATDYGGWFSGSLYKNNFYGCQFHPEKSGAVGGRILANFLTL